MVSTIVVIVLAVTGAAFMIASSYLALSAIYPPALAALMVGGGLVILAGLVWLVSEAMANRRRARAGGIAPIAKAAAGVQSGDEAVEQIVTALKQESPLTVLAAAAGLLFGLFMRGRHHG